LTVLLTFDVPLFVLKDEPVMEHLSKIKTGETLVWGAFDGEDLVGFISGEMCSGYYHKTTHGQHRTCFINEFVVSPEQRGKRIGVHLTAMSVDPVAGVFGVDPDVKEMYTTVHVDNMASRTAFIKGGYAEVVTYDDAHRDRHTTVLKCLHPEHQHDHPHKPVVKPAYVW
jgi:Acetyltransferase (GNAT) family